LLAIEFVGYDLLFKLDARLDNNEIKLSVTAKTLSDQTGLTQCVVPGVATAASAMTHGRRSFLCLHVHHKHGERMGKG
jgi:hypothetical protein